MFSLRLIIRSRLLHQASSEGSSAIAPFELHPLTSCFVDTIAVELVCSDSFRAARRPFFTGLFFFEENHKANSFCSSSIDVSALHDVS